MSLGGFILGSFIMFVGFMAVWKTQWFLNNFGNIGSVIGKHDDGLSNWKIAGVLFLFIGFLVAFGLFSLFFHLTLGQIFSFGVS